MAPKYADKSGSWHHGYLSLISHIYCWCCQSIDPLVKILRFYDHPISAPVTPMVAGPRKTPFSSECY